MRAYTLPASPPARVPPAAFWNEQVRDNLANLRALANVQSTTSTSFVTAAPGVFTDVLTLSITPTATTSKIFVFGRVTFGTVSSTILGFQIVRDSTVVGNTTGGTFNFASSFLNGAGDPMTTIPVMHLDDPNTTSATTYKIQANPVTGNLLLNQRGSDTVVRGSSTLTLMEIPA
jgi:hypothetical protein